MTKNEEKRRSRAARKEEERRLLREKIIRWKLGGRKQQESIEQHGKQYHEMKQLAALNMKLMKEEMEKIETQLKEETSRRDHARKASDIKRMAALTKKKQEKKKEESLRQTDVVVDRLNVQSEFHKSSVEMNQSQRSTSPHADEVEILVISSLYESHCDVFTIEQVAYPVMPYLSESHDNHTVLLVITIQ